MDPATSTPPESDVSAIEVTEASYLNTLQSQVRQSSSIDAMGDDLVDTSWVDIAYGIMLAGGFYPLVVIAIPSVVGLIAVFLHQIAHGDSALNLGESLGMLFGLFLFAGILGLGGIVWSGLVSVVSLPFMYLIAWSLKLRGSVLIWGAFCGGLVGFLTALLPFVLGFLHDSADWSNEFLAWVLALAIGPGIATVMGQIGGAWGGQRAKRKEQKFQSAVELAGNDLDRIQRHPMGDTQAMQRSAKLAFQFRIRHLLWIGVWLSLLLSAIRLSGIPFEYILPLLCGWLVYQAGTLWAGWRLAQWLGPWWRGRRERRCT